MTAPVRKGTPMRRLLVFVGLVAALGMVGVGGYAVAQDAPATPEVVRPGTPEILPELCPTTAGISTPVNIATGTPEGEEATSEDGEATPALVPCATPEGSPAAAGDLVKTVQ